MQANSSIYREKSGLLELLIPFMGCEPRFGHTSGDRCINRGLLPGHLLDSLRVLDFLAVTVISAQSAQRQYGVRASVLISMAIDESAFDVRGLVNDPMIFREPAGERTISHDIDKWFLNRARRLATTKALRKALPCVSVEHYIREICNLGFGDSMKAEDLWANIETYHLEDCDRAGMLPIGEYSSDEYDLVRDAAGNFVGVEPSPLRELIRMAKNAAA